MKTVKLFKGLQTKKRAPPWAAVKPQASLTSLTDRLSSFLPPADIKPHAIIPRRWNPVWAEWTKHTLGICWTDFRFHAVQAETLWLDNIHMLSTKLHKQYDTTLCWGQMASLTFRWFSFHFLCICYCSCSENCWSTVDSGPAAVSLSCSVIWLDSSPTHSSSLFTGLQQQSSCCCVVFVLISLIPCSRSHNTSLRSVAAVQSHSRKGCDEARWHLSLRLDGLTFSRNVFKRSSMLSSRPLRQR